MKRYRDYDPFAWLYTRYWGEEFHHQVMPVIEKLVLSHIPKKARILDLCCGDGRITQSLARKGYDVLGIDGSEQMLAYAKQRSPKVQFLLKDARDFTLPQEFDAAISTFDSLNHIMNTEDLGAVFRNVHASLKAGAQFVFDLNREEAYRDLWARTSTTVTTKVVSVARGTYDGYERVAHCDITLFRLEQGAWERSDFRLSQRFHPEPDVIQALEQTGFTVAVHDGQKLGMQGDIGEGRNFYAAHKTV